MKADHEEIQALLMECSLLPPYGAAIQAAVNLPVFDYITMINFVFFSCGETGIQGVYVDVLKILEITKVI